MDVCRRRTTAVSLPEDVILEILVRLEDQAALFRCAVTCRPWNRLVADASFLRRRLPDRGTSSTFLARYIAPKIFANGANRYYRLDKYFVPTPRSVLGPVRCPLDSFFTEAAAHILCHAVTLMAHRGLLLMRFMPGPAHPAGVLWLAVYNMLPGVCDLLPPLDCNWSFNSIGYSILADADYSSNCPSAPSGSGNPTFFKVLIIDNNNNNNNNYSTY
ncbi:hypothetical protein ACQ4PT_001127 [Festuca glaucescens]